MAGTFNVPVIDDPYVGEVYGNLLDNYATPTYNAKLYMMKKELSVAAKDGVASFDPSLTCQPSDQVILCQTGVTAATIDDIKIEALTNTDGPNAISVDFTIHQPGAATFLDQLQMARAYLGQENDYMPIVFLEIKFQGLTAELDDEDDGGGFADIAGPFRWKLHITNIQVEITSEGSRYDITSLPSKSYAFTSPLFKIPTNLSTVGSTITEHVESLQTELNLYHSETCDDHLVPDEFVFDLSELIAGEGESEGDGTVNNSKINDEAVYKTSDANMDQRNRVLNATYEIGDAVTAKQALVDEPVEEGEEVEPIFEEDKINVPKDMTIEKYFATLLSMNEEFYTKISRKEEIDDAEADAKTDAGYVVWYKMDANVEQLEFDANRKGYAHRVTYKPRLYKSSRPDIAVDAKETEVTKEDYKSRAEQIFSEGGLKKAYHYIFTGLNDQIMNLDIKYDNGIALMVPPKGGALGQAALVLAEKEGAIPVDQDVTLEGVVEEFIEEKGNATAKDIFSDFLDDINKLKDIASDGLSGLVQQLEDATGLDTDVISGALQGNNDANQQALENALDSKALKKLNAQNNVTATEPFPEYEPELSDYKYSVDLVNPMETPMTADDLEALGYLTLEDVEEATEIKQKVDATSKEADPENEAATIKKGSVQNTLFGVIASQHSNDIGFLLQLDMTLRGDPWYLGRDNEDPSDSDAANFYKDDNHFYLGLRSPKTFDMDWRDEDSDINTGYWKGDGVSRSFGGVYRLISVVNNFSNGEYTVDVNAQRVVPTLEPRMTIKDKADAVLDKVGEVVQERLYEEAGLGPNPTAVEIEQAYDPNVPPRPIGRKGDYDSFFSKPIPGTESWSNGYKGTRLNARQWDYRYAKTHLPNGMRRPDVPIGEDD